VLSNTTFHIYTVKGGRRKDEFLPGDDTRGRRGAALHYLSPDQPASSAGGVLSVVLTAQFEMVVTVEAVAPASASEEQALASGRARLEITT
jgi:hypothetical protein